MQNASEYDRFKSRLESMENNPSYFHLKRFYTYALLAWFAGIIAITFLAFLAIDQILKSNRLHRFFPEKQSFIGELQGDILVEEKENIKRLTHAQLPYFFKNGSRVTSLSDHAKLAIQVMPGQFLTVKGKAEFTFHKEKEKIRIAIKHGDIFTHALEKGSVKNYVIQTPQALLSLSRNKIILRVSSKQGYSKISGAVSVKPKVNYLAEKGILPKSLRRQLNSLVFNSNPKDLLHIPSSLTVSKMDMMVFKRLIETGHFHSVAGSLLFRKKSPSS